MHSLKCVFRVAPYNLSALPVHLAFYSLSGKYYQYVAQVLVFYQSLFPKAYVTWKFLCWHELFGCLLALVCLAIRYIWLLANHVNNFWIILVRFSTTSTVLFATP